MPAVIGLVLLLAAVPRLAASEVSLPTGDLPGWRQVLAEDFDTDVGLGSFPGSAYAERFAPYRDFADTFGHGWYDPERVLSVRDGALDWWLHTADGAHRVAAVVVTSPTSGWGQTYGRFSVRFRTEQVPGYKLAFLQWPDSNDWADGEIDFPEGHSLEPDSTILANLYQVGAAANQPGPSTGFDSGVPIADSGWHVATVEWTPDGVSFTLDGVDLGTKTQGIPTASMHWVLQVETSQAGPSPSGDVSGHVQVDWVTMYERAA